MSERVIGFFDSGVGGLSVLKEALKRLNVEKFIYAGDNANMPYGVRKPKDVEYLTEKNLRFLKSKDVELSIIACNTATCYGLENSRKKLCYPIFGVVEPACRYASEVTLNKKVALVATQGTVKSRVYHNTIKRMDSDIDLMGVGCPDLVLAIENGHLDDNYVEFVIKNYLNEFGDYDYDTLILGCTHFPLAQKVFERIFNERGLKVNIVDPALRTVIDVKGFLGEDYLPKVDKSIIEFYATGDVTKFSDTVRKAMNLDKYEVSFNKL